MGEIQSPDDRYPRFPRLQLRYIPIIITVKSARLLRPLAVRLVFLGTVDPVKAGALRAFVVEDFDDVAVEDAGDRA